MEKGEVVGFLGPNGAGKTTTMNMITGYLSPTEGTATVGGHDILEKPREVKRLIGYLPESPPLYPEMTVQQYLTLRRADQGGAATGPGDRRGNGSSRSPASQTCAAG